MVTMHVSLMKLSYKNIYIPFYKIVNVLRLTVANCWVTENFVLGPP